LNARIFQAGEIPWILIISDSDSQILIVTIIAGKYPQDQWEVSAIIASMGAKHIVQCLFFPAWLNPDLQKSISGWDDDIPNINGES